jgi:hypothetical protein
VRPAIAEVSKAVKRPVVMFVDDSDTASIQAAVDAGISAFVVVGGLKRSASSTSSTWPSHASAPMRARSTPASRWA